MNPLNKSSFYVAEAIYEAEGTSENNSLSLTSLPSDSRQSSPDHIYETIPDPLAVVATVDDDLGDQQQRPLPPIPEEKRRQGRR